MKTTRILLWAMTTIVMVGCSHNDANEYCIMPKGTELRAGDVVFRRGGGFTSQAVLMADRDGNYSHCGIVVDSAGVLRVVHAVPGEPDYNGDEDRVKMDTPERFFSNEYASSGEVCRQTDSVVARKATEYAIRQYRRHALFDHDYDSEDTTSYYCTELVVRAYEWAGMPLTGAPQHAFHLPGCNSICWLPSDLRNSEKLKTVTVF